MPKLKKEDVIEKLTEACIDFPEDASYGDLVALLPEKAKKEVKQVPCGASTVQDHEARLCAIEDKLGIP